MVDADEGFTPTPVISHAILTHNRGGGRGQRGRDRRHAVAQPARGRRLQVQPAARRPGRHRRHLVDPERGERPAGRGPRGSRARPVRAGRRRAHGARPRLRLGLCGRAARGRRPRRHPGQRAAPGSGPARRLEPRLLAGDRGAPPARPHDRQRRGSTRPSRFVPVDWDGKIRMDCSSPYAMAGLTELKDRFDVAFGNDPDADRHGIVTPSAGLLNPNHHLAACVAYLFGGNRDWSPAAGVGKTLVSSAIIDRVVADLGRRAGRGPRRVQVVRRRPARRLARVRRRGERGRVVPAPRRLALVHRQGRADPVPARGRDDRARRRRPRRGLPRARGALRRSGLPARRRGGDARSRRRRSASCPPSR